MGILRISGADQSSPIDDSSTPNTAATASPLAFALNTTVGDTLIIRYFGADDDDITQDSGYPGSHTGVYVRGATGGGSGQTSSGVAYTTQAPIGWTGTATFTNALTVSNEHWSAVTIAVKPDLRAAITVANPASLSETNLSGADVTVTITNATYDAPLFTTDFTLNGAPAGTTINGVARDSETQATLTLAFDGTDFDSDASMSVTVLQAALATGTGPATTGTGPATTGTVTVTAALPVLAVEDGRLFYGETGTAQALNRTWDDSLGTWSVENGTAPVSGTVRWTVNKVTTDGSEDLLGVLSDTGSGAELNLVRWDGTAWIVDWSSTAITTANLDKRGFDLEYEASSGDALVVYSNNTDTPVYRTRSGGSWSGESALPLNDGAGPNPDPNTGIVHWVELTPRLGSDEITLAYVDANWDLVAIVWDGTQWLTASASALETDVKQSPGTPNVIQNRPVDVAYEETTGDALIAWGRHGVSGFYYSTRAAGSNSWSAATGVLAPVTGEAYFVDLAAEPGGQQIAGVFMDLGGGTERLGLATWTGSAWVNPGEYDSQTRDVNDNAPGDVVAAVGWLGTSGTAVAVYSDNDVDTIDWATWTSAGGWVLQPDVTPAITGKGYTESVQIEMFGGQNELMAIFSGSNADLYAATYDGATWTVTNSGSALETVLSSVDSAPFSFAIGPPTTLYRSVGTDSANLNTGQTVEIVGTTATFSASMPPKIGVGDVLEYGATNLAFIYGRTSDTVYTVQSATGGTPVATGAGTPVSVFRAYTSLFNWAAQTENTSIAVSVRDFDTSTNLAGDNTIMQVAAYTDGPDAGASEVDITSAWITGANNYIRIYTPVSSSEVGVSQRHTGLAGTGYVRQPVKSSAGHTELLEINTNYVRVEGLEFDGSNVTGAENFYGIFIQVASGSTDIRIEHSLIHDLTNSNNTPASSRYVRGIYSGGTSEDLVKIANTIIYAIANINTSSGSAAHGISLKHDQGASYVYNNIVFDVTSPANTSAAHGMRLGGAAATTHYVKNNYVGQLTCTTCTYTPTAFRLGDGATVNADNNVSFDGSADDFEPPGANGVINQTSYATYFANVTAGSENFHLLADSNTLWGVYGEDVDADPILPVTVDIDGETRDSTQPDVGADEALAVTAAITGTNPGSLTETNLNGATVTVTLTDGTYDASLSTTDFTLNGAPAGTTISGVVRDSATQATLTLAFDGTDFDTNASMSVTVLQAALASGTGPATTGNRDGHGGAGGERGDYGDDPGVADGDEPRWRHGDGDADRRDVRRVAVHDRLHAERGAGGDDDLQREPGQRDAGDLDAGV